MRPIIEIQSISKNFKIQHERQSYLSLRDSFTNIFKSKNTLEEFWALKDVSFDVYPGESIGILGRNGAGKSTLLKILSKITPPYSGKIISRGRIASLLEVGTGFHPELTGRENIYLNGSILGLKRSEINKQFDAIVDFSGVEKFLDTPLKHYSSGMQLRLAFAVAAHLEPEILIIDEVLAVGDAEFQKKCMGKMGEVSKSGRTILFVSHNISALSSLCTKGIVLANGALKFNGDITSAIKYYSGEYLNNITSWEGNEGDDQVRLHKTWIKNNTENLIIESSYDIEVGITVEVLKPIRDLILGFMLYSELGAELAYSLYDDDQDKVLQLITTPGIYTRKFIIPANTLAMGSYKLEFDVGIHMTKKIIASQGELSFSVENISGIGRRHLTPNVKGRSSLFRPNWKVE